MPNAVRDLAVTTRVNNRQTTEQGRAWGRLMAGDDTEGNLSRTFTEMVVGIAQLSARVDALGELMEAKFVTFRTLLDAEARRVELALNSSDKAISKSEKSYDERFTLLNELRSDVATKAQVDAVEVQVSDLKSRLDKIEARTQGGTERVIDQRATIAAVIGLATFVLAVIIVLANFISSR